MPTPRTPPASPPDHRPVNRVTLIVIGGISLLVALGIEIFAPEREAVQAACTRAGIVICALGFALPKPGEKFRWQGIVPLFLVFVLLMALLRNRIHVVIPALVLIGIIVALIRPRSRKRPLR